MNWRTANHRRWRKRNPKPFWYDPKTFHRIAAESARWGMKITDVSPIIIQVDLARMGIKPWLRAAIAEAG